MTPVPARSTFLLLGAAKSGTTTLYHMLSRHPRIQFSNPKEPVFFELEFEKGLEHYLHTYFQAWSGEPVIGEGRVFNLFLPYVPERIHRVLPEARLVVILRDPAWRAYSHWWHRTSRGLERRSFADVVETEIRSLDAGRSFPLKESEAAWRTNVLPGALPGETPTLREVPIVEMGYYADQIDRFVGLFGQEALMVLFLEDLRRDLGRTSERLLEHLGLEPAGAPAGYEPRNVARDRVKSAWAFRLERLAKTTGVHRLVPKAVRRAGIELIGTRMIPRPEPDDEVMRRLDEHYASHDRRLTELLGEELPWREGAS